MSETNNTTIDSYDGHIDEYVAGTPALLPPVINWIKQSLTNLPKNAKLLEVGSAYGQDADFIEGLGYVLDRSDVTPGFVELLKKQGHKVLSLNLLSDQIPLNYDFIFANKVLLHFNRDELKQILIKIHSALNDSGRLVFSLKKGDGEEWSNAKLGAPRYFCYWQIEQINELLEEVGFGSFEIDVAYTSKLGSKFDWLQIIALKN